MDCCATCYICSVCLAAGSPLVSHHYSIYIYGICKVNRIDMRFQQIISKYHEMDELYSPDVITGGDRKAIRDDIIHKIKYVDVQGNQVKVLQGDIIKYYNLMFVAKMKSFLLLFKNRGKGKISAVPEEPVLEGSKRLTCGALRLCIGHKIVSGKKS